MLAWHVPYLGWTRLPAEVSDFEITHFFSLRAEERSAVLTRYRNSLRLGAALQIGFLKMCGRPLDAIQRVPADLLKHLGEQLEIAAPTIATLRALYMKRPTNRRAHRAIRGARLENGTFDIHCTPRPIWQQICGP
jgi:hypothetical protein